MINLTALFYSQNASSVIASFVKSTLNKRNYFTIYVQDIDDILLKKFTNVNFLVLDLVDNQLDYKSYQLLNKLYDTGYIKRIIIIKNKNDNMEYKFSSIILDEKFSTSFSDLVDRVLVVPRQDLKVCNSLCFKIIGNYLISIGFSFKHIGYSMMIDTISYLYVHNCVVKNLKQDIYVYLANKYNKNISSVEMNLRKSIKLAHQRSKNFPFDYTPTNKEFITFIFTELYDKIYANNVI